MEQDAPLQGFPWLMPSKFLQAMGRMNDLGHLLGGRNSILEAGSMLELFWSRFQPLYPSHDLFRDVAAGKKQLSRCIPIYWHGDEGTTYKRGGVLVGSWQSAIGFGTSKRAAEVSERYRQMGEGVPLNFLKTGMQTRILSIICRKDLVFVRCFHKIVLKVLNVFGQ